MTTDTTLTGTVEHLDPNTHFVETNVRATALLHPGFVDSVRQVRVLIPHTITVIGRERSWTR